jgi:cytochrome P450
LFTGEQLYSHGNDFISPLHLITFGGGPHLCIGVNVATIEAKMLAARVVRPYYLETISEHAAEQFGFTDERLAPVSYGS